MNEVEVIQGQGRALTAAEFHTLAEIPPELEWFANLRNPHTRKAYEMICGSSGGLWGLRAPRSFAR